MFKLSIILGSVMDTLRMFRRVRNAPWHVYCKINTTWWMVTGVNRVTLIGRLGRDPETRGSEQNPVVLFSLATSLTLRDPDGRLLRLSAQASVEFGLCNSGQWCDVSCCYFSVHWLYDVNMTILLYAFESVSERIKFYNVLEDLKGSNLVK